MNGNVVGRVSGETSRNRYWAVVLEDIPGQLDQLVDTLHRRSFDVDLCCDVSIALGLSHGFA